jgi:hypothetical protein
MRTQHRNTNSHASTGIRTHDASNQGAKAYALDRADTVSSATIKITFCVLLFLSFLLFSLIYFIYLESSAKEEIKIHTEF